MDIITSIAELDRRLDIAAEASKRSPAAFRSSLDGFVLDPRGIAGPQPKDPRSESYKDWQSQLYDQIAGRGYHTENEKTPFDHEHMMRWPFPYSTQSATLVGDYLMTYGNLIKTMNLAQGARVLEIGSGFGPLTYQLASMGHAVTCVDIHEPLLSYVRERTRALPGRVTTIVADMNDLQLQDSFDAIIFFESFHHGADHVGLLKRLSNLLEPNGLLVLAGEPIVPAGSLAVPYPWGLRVDGLSLWFIRRHGWLELGFEEGYLKSLMHDLGWEVACKPNHASPTMGVWLAKLPPEKSIYAKPYNDGEIARWKASDSRVRTQTGQLSENGERIVSKGQEGYLVYGPYISLDSGFYEVQWVGDGSGVSHSGRVDVTCDGGARVLKAASFSMSESSSPKVSQVLAHLRFAIDEPVVDLEFRLYVGAQSSTSISEIVLRKY